MPSLLDLPLPAPARAQPRSAEVAVERALLEALARTADGADLRSQALVELMALEVTCGDELAFERLRHELEARALPAAVEVLFRARVAFGLARFGRVAAARRWIDGAARGADTETVSAWLLELDRRLDHAGR